MINLIPPQGQTALRHEYILRVASVYGFLLAGVFLSGAALLIPTYVLTSAQLTGAKDESAEIDATKRAFDQAFEEIKVANTVMAQLQKTESTYDTTRVIEEVIRSAPAGISFTSFNAPREGMVLTEITVVGVASTRQTLASFKTSVEASPLFREVRVPLSDLARETNLPFSVTIALSEDGEVPSETETP